MQCPDSPTAPHLQQLLAVADRAHRHQPQHPHHAAGRAEQVLAAKAAARRSWPPLLSAATSMECSAILVLVTVVVPRDGVCERVVALWRLQAGQVGAQPGPGGCAGRQAVQGLKIARGMGGPWTQRGERQRACAAHCGTGHLPCSCAASFLRPKRGCKGPTLGRSGAGALTGRRSPSSPPSMGTSIAASSTLAFWPADWKSRG